MKKKFLIIVFLSLISFALADECVIEDTNIVGYWPLEEGNGSKTEDWILSNNGTLNGNVGWTTGKVGNALSLNGGGCVVMDEIGYKLF